MISPNTKIVFCNVPFSSTSERVLTFDSLQSQINYFDSKCVIPKTGCTYQRENEENGIKVGLTYEQLENVNYLFFRNKNNKFYFAYVSKIDYLSPNTCKVYFKIDVMQTYMFNMNFGKSFIERSTFAEDSYNSIEDYPSTGELKSSIIKDEKLMGKYMLFMNSEVNNDDSSTATAYFPKVGHYAIPEYVSVFSDCETLAETVQAISNKGRSERIQGCVYQPFLPMDCIKQIGSHSKGDLSIKNDIFLVSEIDYSHCKKDIELNINYNYEYLKELTYPYCEIEVVDKITGQKITLDLSKFENPLKPKFRILGSVCEKPEYKVIPLNYNGISYAIDYALIVNPNTELPIYSNTYAQYLKDNKNSNLINGVMTGVSAVGSLLSGNIMGMIGSFGNIASILNADSVAQKQPNKCVGTSSNVVEYTNLDNGIEFRLLNMDDSHKNQARQFWKYYGYPLKEYRNFSIPNSNYHFVKMQGCNVYGEIPNIYIIQINEKFNSGISFCNNENALLNY